MILLQVIYVSFPLVLGGVLQALVLRWQWCSRLAIPLDLGRTFRGKRLFGDKKTLRGLLVMVTGAIIGMYIQAGLYSIDVFRMLSFFDYTQMNPVLGGTVLGVGFILAELPNSFLKRQCHIPPGQRGTGLLFWVFTILDQTDSVLGCLMAAALTFWVPDWTVVCVALVMGVLLHMAVNGVFVVMGVKERVV